MVKMHPIEWLKSIYKNKIILIFSIFLIVLVSIIAGLVILAKLNPTLLESYKYDSLSNEEKEAKDWELYTKADEQYFGGGSYEEAQKTFDDALSIRLKDSSKGIIYRYKSLLALNAEKYDEALTFAKNAEQLNPTHLTAATLGRIYFIKKEYQLSAENYQNAASRTENPNDSTVNSSYNDYVLLKSQAEDMVDD